MEILFKCDRSFYYIEYDELCWGNLLDCPDVNLDSIPHLGIIKVLYHYRYTKTGERFPVYYEHNELFITRDIFGYHISESEEWHTKDYTLVNLKLL